MTVQTAHTPARINPDHLAVLIVATVLTALLAATSFMLSFAALEAVAAWAAVPDGLTWAVPVFIDAAILVYTLAALVARARGESARAAWCSLALWTIVSVTANALHAWADIPDEVRTVAGMTIAGLAPIAVLLATHTLADLVVAKPAATSAVTAVAETPVAEPVTPVAEPVTPVAGAVTVSRTAVADAVSPVPSPVAEPDGVVAVDDEDERPAAVAPVAARLAAVAPVAARLAAVPARRQPSRWTTADEARIAELARTTHLSGRQIAEQLGTNRNRTCALVGQVRERAAATDVLRVEPEAALA